MPIYLHLVQSDVQTQSVDSESIFFRLPQETRFMFLNKWLLLVDIVMRDSRSRSGFRSTGTTRSRSTTWACWSYEKGTWTRRGPTFTRRPAWRRTCSSPTSTGRYWPSSSATFRSPSNWYPSPWRRSPTTRTPPSSCASSSNTSPCCRAKRACVSCADQTQRSAVA